ncbi:hypothetical protein PHAVU_006G064400 [Phaseolus vulgaris]|uniref:Prolamin-like domain-containing protein n=1 Tax=Phaseolus vulgaris TaxID=3885 RepID=V7BNV8_PHAVU|nr:hypothetical protein PHAVU_006G064400g [Phaseolus vulgaris]ESW18718.1 hypothetical protein PHAVU_006G064400g [Phaseolus vulgaris]
MAASIKLCEMMMFLAIVNSLVKPSISYEDFDPYEGPISPMNSYEKLLTDCILKLHPPCDDLYMFGTMFLDNETITQNCCNNIREVGKQCHDTLTTYVINLRGSKENKPQILQRSKQIWNECNHPSSFKQYLIDSSTKFH